MFIHAQSVSAYNFGKKLRYFDHFKFVIRQMSNIPGDSDVFFLVK